MSDSPRVLPLSSAVWNRTLLPVSRVGVVFTSHGRGFRKRYSLFGINIKACRDAFHDRDAAASSTRATISEYDVTQHVVVAYRGCHDSEKRRDLTFDFVCGHFLCLPSAEHASNLFRARFPSFLLVSWIRFVRHFVFSGTTFVTSRRAPSTKRWRRAVQQKFCRSR